MTHSVPTLIHREDSTEYRRQVSQFIRLSAYVSMGNQQSGGTGGGLPPGFPGGPWTTREKGPEGKEEKTLRVARWPFTLVKEGEEGPSARR